MKYSQFREEQAAFGKINGLFTLIAYLIRFRMKELFFILILFLLAWITTIIINPSIAVSVKTMIIRML
jgi:hypothetical protein